MREINYICVVFFTIECVARLVTTPNRKAFLMDYKNWIDFVSVAPSYLVLFVKNKWVKNLVIIRLLRVFKFFKLSYGLQVMLHTLKASSYELTLLLLILLIPLVIFSSLVYAVESNFVAKDPTKFTSIPVTFWWCLITMTTVGYGDITPLTWPGQIIGSVCAIFGLLIIALPISVIGGNFSLYYAHVRARLKLPRKNRKLLQGNMRGLLRHPLSLSLRDRDRKLKRTNQKAIRLKPERTSPSPFPDYSIRDDDIISNHSNDSADTAQLLEEHTKLENMPRTRNLRRTALIQMSSSNESVDSNTSTNTVEKETQTYDNPLDVVYGSNDSLVAPLNVTPNDEEVESGGNDLTSRFVGNGHFRPYEDVDYAKLQQANDNPCDSSGSNRRWTDDNLVTQSNDDLPANNVLQPTSIDRTPSQSSSWSSCGSPATGFCDSNPESLNNFHDTPKLTGQSDFNRTAPDKSIDDDNLKDDKYDDESQTSPPKNENSNENDINDNLSKIELELNRNSERILLENLKKLNNISKSLDESVSSFHRPDIEKSTDPVNDPKRRISMKLLTNCDQLMMNKPVKQPENGFLNNNSNNDNNNNNNSNDKKNTMNKYHLQKALAPTAFMNFHSPRKKFEPLKSQDRIVEEANGSDCSSDKETIVPRKSCRHGSIRKENGGFVVGNIELLNKIETLSNDNDNINSNNNDNDDNNNSTSDNIAGKKEFLNNNPITLSAGIYNTDDANDDGPPARNLSELNLLSPNLSHKGRVKSESDLTYCVRHGELLRNRSELNILTMNVKESGV